MENFPFIDCHLHFHDPRMTNRNIIGIILDEFPFIKSFYDKPEDNSVLLGMMDAINCERAWVINYESKMMGYSIGTNDWVSTFCEDSSDRLIPIGGINPYRHENAGSMLRDYLESGLIKGVKIHGPHQLLAPNAYTNGLESQRKMYEVCEELKAPVIWHTGSSIFSDARSKFGNPLHLEDVLIDFPDIIPIMAHGGRPFWMREAEYMMIKFEQLYFDLSGVPPSLLPKYFPRFHRYADRVIFGSDYPSPKVPNPRVNANSIDNLPLDQEVKDKIFIENAVKIMKT